MVRENIYRRDKSTWILFNRPVPGANTNRVPSTFLSQPSLFLSLPSLPSPSATTATSGTFVRGAVYYNVECELSRHRAVITVWDRPGLAAEPLPPFPSPPPTSPPFALFNPAAPQQDPITKGLSRHAGRLPFYSGEPPFQEEIIILFTRERAAAFSRRPRLRSL